VANYFGVGAYLRPLEDVRRAAVPFASECLAFANVPDETPRDYEQGVMRDVGASWDFADVRDHYLQLLHGVSRADDDYWERSRFVTGEVMAEVFGEWRRYASTTSGGFILWSRDLVPGAGWGLLDHQGNPKVALHLLGRALAPVAVWMTDEGLNGISVHVANDRPEELHARLRVALYRGGEMCVGEATEPVKVLPRSVVAQGVEEILGRFVDVSYAYRFGEPQQDLVVATLERGEEVISQAVRFPLGRPRALETADQLGLVATASAGRDSIEVTLGSRRFVYGARLARSGFVPVEDVFNIEPGHSRTITMSPTSEQPSADDGSVVLRALNLTGSLRVTSS
jgi:beta-mannosidase